MNEETGWVVEHGDSEVCAPMYLAGFNPVTWSHAHLDAIRFARKQDAAKACPDPVHVHRICEHVWGDGPAPR